MNHCHVGNLDANCDADDNENDNDLNMGLNWLQGLLLQIAVPYLA